jgi:hypothetical protein
MFLSRTAQPLLVCSSLLILLLAPAELRAADARVEDSTAAAVRWSLLGAPESEGHDSEAAVVKAGCDKLRKDPPRSVNSETRISRCGDAIKPTASARNYRVSYTVLAHDRTLNHDTVTDSSYLIQRKAHCPTTSHPYLREDDANRFQYSCWRCPLAEVRPISPRFTSADTVRWFRGNQCPMDFDQRVADDGRKLTPISLPLKQKLPVANELSAADFATLRVLRDAPYGKLVELQLGNAERVFFINGEPSPDGTVNPMLQAANSKYGSLSERDGRWVWLAGNQTEYQFDATKEGFSKVSSKRSRDGKRWRYHWQKLATAATTGVLPSQHRLDSMEDSNQQRYQLHYDQRGQVSRLIMQGSGAITRVASAGE